MRVALFVPCFMDQLRPRSARAALELLERLGVEVEFPLAQTCCGQPMANAGCEREAIAVCRHFAAVFGGYDYVVCPSASCVRHVRHHYDVLEQTAAVRHVRERTLELCQFLVEVLRVESLDVEFPHRVGLHHGCHGLRGLRLGRASELGGSCEGDWAGGARGTSDGGAHAEPGPTDPGGPAARLLRMVRGLTLAELDRPDECCGFGGTFSVTEDAVSARMGQDRVADHLRHGVEVVASADASCLMHLEGVIRRRQLPMRVMHVAEILAGAQS